MKFKILRMLVESILQEEGGRLESIVELLKLTFTSAMKLGFVEKSDERLLTILENDENYWAVDDITNGEANVKFVVDAIPYLYETDYFPEDYGVVELQDELSDYGVDDNSYVNDLFRVKKMPSDNFLHSYASMIMRRMEGAYEETVDYPTVIVLIDFLTQFIEYAIQNNIEFTIAEEVISSLTLKSRGNLDEELFDNRDLINIIDDITSTVSKNIKSSIKNHVSINVFSNYVLKFFKKFYRELNKYQEFTKVSLNTFNGFKITKMRKDEVNSIVFTSGHFYEIPHRFIQAFVHQKTQWE